MEVSKIDFEVSSIPNSDYVKVYPITDRAKKFVEPFLSTIGKVDLDTFIIFMKLFRRANFSFQFLNLCYDEEIDLEKIVEQSR